MQAVHIEVTSSQASESPPCICALVPIAEALTASRSGGPARDTTAGASTQEVPHSLGMCSEEVGSSIEGLGNSRQRRHQRPVRRNHLTAQLECGAAAQRQPTVLE
ncbi:hypothetical protein THAOC_20165 [Thalassiosira oceanica]|uniref:Uncharacterized protein n=1 Tax=Thalassiosira oceanica TaxID=159749 RepID=K0S424_THAOC|nr:hypothetical protein THAOC_20165 [Thalassiosira oceanica]|eukprot:EJK59589.1 hypothetical protein THAOC_20165 [Thalassiosira oceanica]